MRTHYGSLQTAKLKGPEQSFPQAEQVHKVNTSNVNKSLSIALPVGRACNCIQ